MFSKHLHHHPDLGLDAGQVHVETQSRYVEPSTKAWPVQDLERWIYRAFRSVSGTMIFLRWLPHPVTLCFPVQASAQLFLRIDRTPRLSPIPVNLPV
jgi:hypothetical protein